MKCAHLRIVVPNENKSKKRKPMHQTLSRGDLLFASSNAKVYHATHLPTNTAVVWKKSKYFSSENDIFRELEKMQKTRRLAIVKFFDGWVDDKKHVHTILEFAGKDLLTYLQPGNTTSCQSMLEFLKGVSEALLVLLELGYVHRDITLENILVHHGTCLLCDFGLSAPVLPLRVYEMTGKANYIAPELYCRTMQYDGYDISLADVFSLGICAFACLVGRFPATVEDMMKHPSLDALLFGFPEFANLPATIRDLLLGMLQINPKNRLSMQSVFAKCLIYI
jgi:serine/threonine protein kinase